MSDLDRVESQLGSPRALAPEGIRPRKEVSDTAAKQEPKGEAGGMTPTASPEVVATAVNNVNTFLQDFRSSIRFEISEASDQLMVKIVDRETDEVIRTIPPERALEAQAKLEEALGLIFDEES